MVALRSKTLWQITEHKGKTQSTRANYEAHWQNINAKAKDNVHRANLKSQQQITKLVLPER